MLGGVAKDQVPEIVYRSTPSPTTDVLPNKDGILYTSPDEAYTKNFGPHTVRLEVAPRKTLDLSHFPPDEDVPGADMVQALQDRGVKISAELMDRLSEGGEVLQHFGQYGKKMLVDAIRKAGYDSARINEYVHGSGSAKSLLVFDPKIVKRTP